MLRLVKWSRQTGGTSRANRRDTAGVEQRGESGLLQAAKWKKDWLEVTSVGQPRTLSGERNGRLDI